MDVYYEHIVRIRKTGRDALFLILIWLVAIGFSFLAFWAIGFFSPLPVLLTTAAIYGGVTLTKKLNVEFEYIFTNGEIDIDIITAKSDRKRLVTFECKDILRVERYNRENPLSKRENFEKANVYCNKDDSELYSLVIKRSSGGNICVTIQIKDELKEKMLPYMDKLLAREAFK